MSSPRYLDIIRDGLWTQNTGLVRLLGLCPLLAVSNNVVNGVGLGLATTLSLVLSNVLVSLIRNWVPTEIRLPVFVLVIASSVTAVELVMKAFYYDLYLVLGIFIPLIVTNCAVIGRAEAFAAKNTVGRSLVDGLSTGLGFTWVLSSLGGLREILAQGTLFGQAEMMFGTLAQGVTVHLFDHYGGFLIAALPPGAFIGLALLIALKNWLDQRLKSRKPQAVPVSFLEHTPNESAPAS